MSTTTASSIRSRPSLDYDPAEGCFCDHRGAPYRFRDQVRQLQKTAESTQPGGMVEQSGLTAIHLPCPKIVLEPPTENEDCGLPIDPVVSPYSVFPFLGRTKQLRLPSESLDLGYDTKGEVEQYLHDIQSAKSCNIFTSWLPLAKVNVEKDEGLDFSSTVSRWQMLALRQMEVNEAPGPMQDTISIYDQGFDKKAFTPVQLREIFSLRKFSSTCLEPVSPPLSSASEPFEHYVPDPAAAVIELTSEPSSPINEVEEKFQSDVENDCLLSGPAGLLCMSSPAPAARAVFFGQKSNKSSELKLDLPLLSSSPAFSLKSYCMAAALTPNVIDPEASFETEVGQGEFFEEAFQTFLNSKHHQAIKRLDQERISPTDALLRLPIPAVDFDIPNPEWGDYLSSSKQHYKWLSQRLSSAFHLPHFEGMNRLDSSLRWTPIPPRGGRVSLTEAAIELGPLSRQLLSLQPPQLCSRDYITSRPTPVVLQISPDEDVDLEGEATEMISLAVLSENHVIPLPNNKDCEPSNIPSLDDLLRSRRQSLSSQTNDKRKKRLLADTNSTAASSLLSNFMQLRQPKRLKTGIDICAPLAQSTSTPQTNGISPSSEMQKAAQSKLEEAPAPVINMPREKCRYIISIDLSCKIISCMEKSWPQTELIDRDFNQHNTVSWSPGSTQRSEIVSPLAFEADLSLCPAAGLIMTTIIRVKQKSLPGSTTLSPFRERVKRVSEKYEYLFVLVSEANPEGEYVGSPTVSDINGYADFVRFTTSLRANISTYLISGAEGTISKWALSIMSRYSSAAIEFRQFLDFRDSDWVMFFRRAGFNICAAQVLAGLLLSEYGQYGLTNFLSMNAIDRVSKFGQIMGGNRVLNNVSRILDREWV